MAGTGNAIQMDDTSSNRETHFIELEGSLSKTMKQKLVDALGRRSNEIEQFTIFRIPENVRRGKSNLIEPSVVSIGPYHRGREHLQALEEKKWCFLQDFLSRGHGVTLETCIKEIKALEERARRCYRETFTMDSDAFVEMMVLDGCFILEILKKLMEGNIHEILGPGWSCHFMRTDLLLMENQIPFFIIRKLREIVTGEKIFSYPEMRLLVYFLTVDERLMEEEWNPLHPKKIHHLLHLCHHFTVPEIPNNSNGVSDPERSTMVIPCATELREAGIKFKKKNPPCYPIEITFRSGTLEIPYFQIDDSVKILLMNLIAIEQCVLVNVPKPITSYTYFMDCIVNTSNDVAILQRKGIIENMLSGEEEVADFFNQLGVGRVIDTDHHLSKLFEEVNKYCELKRHKYRAKLSRNHFSNPWSIISLIAAFVLLVLTFLQTFFAVYSYFRPPS